MSKNHNQKRRDKRQSKIPTALVIVAAFVAGFVIFGLVLRPGGGESAASISSLAPDQYVSEFVNDGEHLLIDVRTPEEFATGHIPGAINIPVDSLAGELDQLPEDTEIVVYCRSGNRSATASRILAGAGFSVFDLGGILRWTADGYPVQ